MKKNIIYSQPVISGHYINLGHVSGFMADITRERLKGSKLPNNDVLFQAFKNLYKEAINELERYCPQTYYPFINSLIELLNENSVLEPIKEDCLNMAENLKRIIDKHPYYPAPKILHIEKANRLTALKMYLDGNEPSYREQRAIYGHYIEWKHFFEGKPYTDKHFSKKIGPPLQMTSFKEKKRNEKRRREKPISKNRIIELLSQLDPQRRQLAFEKIIAAQKLK